MTEKHSFRSEGLGLTAFFFREKPWQLTAVILLQFTSGVLENIGLMALLPFAQFALNQSDADSLPSRLIKEAFAIIELPMTLPIMLIFILLVMLMKIGLSTISQVYNFRLALDIVTSQRQQLMQRLVNAAWSHHLEIKPGRIVNLVGNEAERVRPALASSIAIITETLQGLLYIASSLIVSWPLTALAIGLGILKFLLLYPLQRVARRGGQEQSRSLTALSGQIVDILHSMKPIKAMAREDGTRQYLSGEIRRHAAAQRLNYMSQTALKNLDELYEVVVLIFLAYLAVGFLDSSLPELAVIGILLTRTLGKVGGLQRSFANIAAYEASMRHIRDTLEELRANDETHHGGLPPTFETGIELRDIHLSYAGKEVLRNVNIKIPARRMTAIVGPSGSGKTSILDILLGLIPVDSGHVLIDGKSLKDVDLNAWRSQIGYVPQELLLMHDTIRSNLVFGLPNCRDEDVRAALVSAEADGFVDQLPDGIDTIVGQRGLKLSGGQRQRLAIARALLHKPKLLILDEATTALDTRTEAEICQMLQRLSRSVTIVAISHQPAIAAVADTVISLQQVNAFQATAI
ncbi:MAG: ABC transporter ATP-binding protein [Ferrovibrio sp.]